MWLESNKSKVSLPFKQLLMLYNSFLICILTISAVSKHITVALETFPSTLDPEVEWVVVLPTRGVHKFICIWTRQGRERF